MNFIVVYISARLFFCQKQYILVRIQTQALRHVTGFKDVKDHSATQPRQFSRQANP